MGGPDNASTARSLRHNSDAIYENLRRLVRLEAIPLPPAPHIQRGDGLKAMRCRFQRRVALGRNV